MGCPREIPLLTEVSVRGSHRPVSPCNAPCSLSERDYLEVGFIEGGLIVLFPRGLGSMVLQV